MKGSKLVYTTDPKAVEEGRWKFTAVLRIEKQGRGGKTVTVIDGLPKMETFLKPLAQELKKACGAGGTFRMDGRDGVIEVQGEQRDKVRTILKEKGYQVKG